MVGGLEVLGALEKLTTDQEDRPLEEAKILRASVFVDPFQEAEEQVCISLFS